MIIRYRRSANARLQALPKPPQAQAKRRIRAILRANTTVGRPWNQDMRGRLPWIVSAADTPLEPTTCNLAPGLVVPMPTLPVVIAVTPTSGLIFIPELSKTI